MKATTFGLAAVLLGAVPAAALDVKRPVWELTCAEYLQSAKSMQAGGNAYLTSQSFVEDAILVSRVVAWLEGYFLGGEDQGWTDFDAIPEVDPMPPMENVNALCVGNPDYTMLKVARIFY